LTPSVVTLKEELKRLRTPKLSTYEENQLIQSLERVWHIIRLMKLLQAYFKDKIVFGGGAILNYIFLRSMNELPRFTFDLDSSWTKEVSSKRVFLKELLLFNKHLSESSNVLYIPVSRDRYISLYVVEYDAEKNHFPNILSLRYPVICRWSGEEFHKYVKRTSRIEVEYGILRKLRRVFEEALNVKSAKVDYVRFEISFGESFPVKTYRVELPFNLGTLDLNVTEIEYQLASKIAWRLGKDFGDNIEYVLHDLLKTLLDLRLLKIVNRDKVEEYVEKILGKRLVELRDKIKDNLATLLHKGGLYWNSHHYILIRKERTLDEIVDEIISLLL